MAAFWRICSLFRANSLPVIAINLPVPGKNIPVICLLSGRRSDGFSRGPVTFFAETSSRTGLIPHGFQGLVILYLQKNGLGYN
jgi:hypothetical protein